MCIRDSVVVVAVVSVVAEILLAIAAEH